MMRTTLTATALVLSVLLASCSTSSPESDDTNAQSGGNNQGLGTGDNNNGDDNNSDTSVAGLWDFSDIIDETYQYWTDNGTITVYDYQGDGDGTGENCFELLDLTYTRNGDEFTIDGVTETITRSDDTLTVEGVAFPRVISFSVSDLEPCI